MAFVEGDRASVLKSVDVIMRIDLLYLRPAEVDALLGDATKVKEKLDWEPVISTHEMCAEMISQD